jgi:spore maturation protein CgeB
MYGGVDMNICMFYHSIISDWNHGNAHFLRGIVTELLSRGHKVKIFEPENSWSVQNLVQDHGESAIENFYAAFPHFKNKVERYNEETFDLDKALSGADLVIVHEWNSHNLVARIGKHRAQNKNYRLLFHDTHHRIVSDFESMRNYDLNHFDGVLAFGKVITEMYKEKSLTQNAWTWHEGVDTSFFKPINSPEKELDLVWVGNWGDGERVNELNEFLFQPVRELHLRAQIYGVRYPQEALQNLQRFQIEYKGWLPNFLVPQIFAKAQATVHVPRGPYVKALPGIPTIRMFEALACGIPLVSAPWDDVEGLFEPGRDYLVAKNQAEMKRHLNLIRNDREVANEFVENGLARIRQRHTCAHRVDELLKIYSEVEVSA